AAADKFLASDIDFLSVVAALQKSGFEDVAQNILQMGRERLAGDYLQPAAIFDNDFHVHSAINDPNDYAGPGTGYRPQGDRWREMQDLPQVKPPQAFIDDRMGTPLTRLGELGPAAAGTHPEVVVAVGPAFGTALTQTINGLSHEQVLEAI